MEKLSAKTFYIMIASDESSIISLCNKTSQEKKCLNQCH